MVVVVAVADVDGDGVAPGSIALGGSPICDGAPEEGAPADVTVTRLGFGASSVRKDGVAAAQPMHSPTITGQRLVRTVALPSAQRTRFQLRRPSEREGGVGCKPEFGSRCHWQLRGVHIDPQLETGIANLVLERKTHELCLMVTQCASER